jgi:hypothetical protein
LISSQTAFGLADLELSRLHLYEEFLFKTFCNLYNLVNVFKSQSQQVQKRCAHSQIFPKQAKCTYHYNKGLGALVLFIKPTMAVFLVTYPSCLNAKIDPKWSKMSKCARQISKSDQVCLDLPGSLAGQGRLESGALGDPL